MISSGHGAKVLGIVLGSILLFSSFQIGLDNLFQAEQSSPSIDNTVTNDDKQAFAQTPPTPDNDIGRIKNYAVYGLNSVRIGENVTVNSGNVGAHNSITGLQLSLNSAEVSIEPNAKVIGTNSAVVGDSVRIKMGAVIQNVFFNEILNQGTIQGTQNTPLALPVVRCLPPLPSFSAGITSINVAAGSSLTIDSGDFGDIVVQQSGTLTLSGGVYNIKSIEAQKDAKLLFDDATQIRVKEGIRWAKGVTVGPSSTSTIDASNIVFFVEGVTATINEVLTTELGKDAIVKANVYAPHADILLKKGTTGIGAFIGKNVMIEMDSSITHKPAIDCAQITWDPAILDIEAKPFVPLQVNFTSSESIQGAAALVSDEIKKLIIPEPATFASINATELQNLTLGMLIPPSTTSGWHNGTISISVNGIELSDSFVLNIFVPNITSTTSVTPNGNFTVLATPSSSPFFNDTSDISLFFTFNNGTTISGPVFYDVFDNSTGAQTLSSGSEPFLASIVPFETSNDLFSNGANLPNFFNFPSALAQTTVKIGLENCTKYGIRYDFKDSVGAFRNPAGVQSDLNNATQALKANETHPLIVRADIFWRDVDRGQMNSTGDWVHESWDDSAIDFLFQNVITEGKKGYVILGTHEPPEKLVDHPSGGRTPASKLPVAQYKPRFQDDAKAFIEHVIEYIQSKPGWIDRVEFWQIDNEPNSHPLFGFKTGLPRRSTFVDWATTAEALSFWLDTVRKLDPDRPRVINVYQASAFSFARLDPDTFSFWSTKRVQPFKNLLDSTLPPKTVGKNLAANMTIMGFDFFPDQWVFLDTSNLQGFKDALEERDSQMNFARKDPFNFAGRWAIVELPAGPKDEHPNLGFVTANITSFDVSEMMGEVHRRYGITREAIGDTPALISFFQLRALNKGAEANFYPFHQAYGLINDINGTTNTDFFNAVQSSVDQNCPRPAPTIPIGSGSISGFTFNDINGNGFKDPGEPALADRTILLFIDASLGKSTKTDSNGFYIFRDLGDANYNVMEERPRGWINTRLPQTMTMFANATLTNRDIASHQLAPMTPPGVFEPSTIRSPSEVGGVKFSECASINCHVRFQTNVNGADYWIDTIGSLDYGYWFFGISGVARSPPDGIVKINGEFQKRDSLPGFVTGGLFVLLLAPDGKQIMDIQEVVPTGSHGFWLNVTATFELEPGELYRIGIGRVDAWIADYRLEGGWRNVATPSEVLDFYIVASPRVGTLAPGQSIRVPIDILSNKVSGIPSVTLVQTPSRMKLPLGVTASFEPGSGKPDFNSTLILSAQPNAQFGTFPINIIGESPNGALISRYTLTVGFTPTTFSAKTFPPGHFVNLKQIQAFGLAWEVNTIGSSDFGYNFMGFTDSQIYKVNSTGAITVTGNFLLNDNLGIFRPSGSILVLYVLSADAESILASTIVLDHTSPLNTWISRDVTVTGLAPDSLVRIGIGRPDAWAQDYRLVAAWANVAIMNQNSNNLQTTTHLAPEPTTAYNFTASITPTNATLIKPNNSVNATLSVMWNNISEVLPLNVTLQHNDYGIMMVPSMPSYANLTSGEVETTFELSFAVPSDIAIGTYTTTIVVTEICNCSNPVTRTVEFVIKIE